MPSAAETVAAAIRCWRPSADPLVVALDGRGAAGKSTLCAGLAAAPDLTIVHTDDFFRPIADQQQAAARDELPMARYYDWPRLREEALIPLRAGRAATFRAFDEATGTFAPQPRTVAPAAVILLEGVSSAAPALADLVDRRVLVDAPQAERLERLRRLIPPDAWDEQWLAEEERYLTQLGHRHFDLSVSGSVL